MDALNQIDKPMNCNKHNQAIIMFDPNLKKRGYCPSCLNEKTGMIPVEDYLQKLNVFINQSEVQCNTSITFLQNQHESIANYKIKLTQCLDKIMKIILEQIETFQKFIFKLKNLNQSSENQDESIDDLQIEFQQYKFRLEEVKNQVKKQLEDFQKKYFNNLDDLLHRPQTALNSQYELIKEYNKDQKKFFWAFAFSKYNTILAAACQSEIIMYEFNKGVIGKELQRLNNHPCYVTCLKFMNRSNSFVSGSCDNLIIIWELDKWENQWFVKQALKEHQYSINCMLLNKDGDLLISGSDDKTIRVWNLINNSCSRIHTISTNYIVYAISFNELEDKLISCGSDEIISVIKKISDRKWSIIQTIKVSNFGSQICFTTEDQFIFKPFKSNQLEVYNFNKEKQEFVLLKQVQIESQEQNNKFFSCQYNKYQKLLQVRYGKNIYILKVNCNSDYQLIQSIGFQDYNLYGRLSEDGQYLVTWDKGSYQIQIRELKYQQ